MVAYDSAQPVVVHGAHEGQKELRIETDIRGARQPGYASQRRGNPGD